uniref:Bromo domain-containing protein n=1 Tax=Wuchereria bancrofti TaxID=6293 RepID=A0A1I8EQ81_WUCBA
MVDVRGNIRVTLAGMSRNIVRKSDYGAPPTRMSAGAPPSLPVRRASKGGFRNVTSTISRKRRSEGNLETEDSDSEQASTADDQEENGSGDDIKKEEEQEEKVKKTPRKKRRFRLTDSIAKSKRRAERRAQLAAERKEREESKQQQEDEVNDEVKEHSLTPPPLPKAATVLTYSPMQLFCDSLLRKMKAKDPDEYFAFPKDAELIVHNAMDYNSPGTVYYIAAQKMDLIVQFYFSEPYLRYLFHTLPFSKEIPLEKLGLTLKTKARPLPKADYKTAVVDDATPSTVLETVDPSLKQKLSSRIPDLRVFPTGDQEDGVEPKSHLAFLDNKDGAICLNVINPSSSEKKIITLGDIVGKLEEGTPGLCAPQEHKSNHQVPISYVSYGPFSSFAPQFDSTWATLCERDSRLLLGTYGDRTNVTNAISLREMVDNCGEYMIKVVDDLLDTLTNGEHRRTIKALETDADKSSVSQMKNAVDKIDLNKLLSDVESLENIGIDVSFTSDIRKLYKLQTVPETHQATLNKTGVMISDLALLQKNRLNSVPPTTLTEQPPPSSHELNLANKVQGKLHSQIAQYAKPGNVISPPVIHNAVGLNEEDIDLLNEFFTAAPPTTVV